MPTRILVGKKEKKETEKSVFKYKKMIKIVCNYYCWGIKTRKEYQIKCAKITKLQPAY